MSSRFITLLLLVTALIGLAGCTTSKPYPPPSLVLDLVGKDASAEVTLHTVIVPGGPDALTEKAYWDEYVLTITNHGPTPRTIEAVFLEDILNRHQAASNDLKKLTKSTVENWKTYRKEKVPVAKEKFERRVPPAAAAPVAAAEIALNPLELIFIPIGQGAESERLIKLQKELAGRQLEFPLTLGPDSSAMGSVFFPMTAGPRRLVVQAQGEGKPVELVITLEPLSRLHLAVTR